MKKARILCIPILMLFSVTISSAQTDFLAQARKLLDKGNCKGAQVYYDMAVKEGKKDVDLERQIKECGGKTPATTPPKSKPTPTTTPPKSEPTPTSTYSKVGNDLVFTVKGVKFTMKYVEGGSFLMGAQNTDPSGTNYDSDAYDKEKPVHSVTLGSYYIGETEVTQALWEAVMGSNPSYSKGDNLPVESVSWNDCQDFIRKLNQLTGKNFSLPTEAQWEYAARGGNKGNGCKYAGSSSIGNVAWYDGNSGNKTHPVKTKQANELGLYDMSGNVWEWCQDWYGNYSSASQTNPTGPASGSYRVLRGGCWFYSEGYSCVSNRDRFDPGRRAGNFGFRLVLPQ